MKKIMSFVSALFLMLALSTNAFATVGQATEDTAITTEAKTMLFEKKLFDGANFNPLNVHVETKEGVVLLTGHVKTEAEKGRAAEIVQSVKGVKSVDNQLAITP